MYDEVTAATQATAAGISRRDMLKRSAVVGGAGALMWAAPSITKFGGAAAWGTPLGQGVSHIAIRYTCNGVEGWVKWDFNKKPYSPGTFTGNDSDQFDISTGAFDSCDCDGMGNCPKAITKDEKDRINALGGNPSLFEIVIDDVSDDPEREVLRATVRFANPQTECSINGNAWVKCGKNCTQLSGTTSVSVSDGDCPKPEGGGQ